MTLPRRKHALLLTASAAVALQIAGCVSTWACDGQVGKVIFEDTFTDDSGGWDLAPPEVTINPPDLLLAPDKKWPGYSSQNITFNATDGDYCLEAILPPVTAVGGRKGVGIELWGTDYNNFIAAELGADSSVSLWRRQSGNWNSIFNVPSTPAFKPGPEAVNTLRVVAKAGKLTIYVNGTQIKSVRAQAPDGKLRFGVYGEFIDSSKAIDDSPAIKVKSYKVTAGE